MTETSKPKSSKATPSQQAADPLVDGFVGTVPDPTPNEAYALPNAGDGTPETDKAAFDAAQQALKDADGPRGPGASEAPEA